MNPYARRGVTLLVGLILGYLLTLTPEISAHQLDYIFALVFALVFMSAVAI